MGETLHSDLAETYGRAHVPALVSAYEQALFTISQGRLQAVLDRETRLLIVKEILKEAKLNGFDARRMADAAIAALGAHTADSPSVPPPVTHPTSFRAAGWLRRCLRLPLSSAPL